MIAVRMLADTERRQEREEWPADPGATMRALCPDIPFKEVCSGIRRLMIGPTQRCELQPGHVGPCEFSDPPKVSRVKSPPLPTTKWRKLAEDVAQ